MSCLHSPLFTLHSRIIPFSGLIMDAKDQFAKPEHAKIYRCYRRETPKWIIEKAIACLKEKYEGPLETAVDVGCGSGQSTVNLAPFFKRVCGIDVSEAQIEEAKTNRALPNVTYGIGPAEMIPFDDGSVQVVSAGAALHWFQLDAFFPEARRVLCNNGILVVYCPFSLTPVLEDPALTSKIDNLWNEIYETTADYHAPQVNIAYDNYKNVAFPFEEVSRYDDLRDFFDGELKDIIGYLNTFSGIQHFKTDNEKEATKFFKHVETRFREIISEANINPDGPFKVYRHYCLILCRKIVK